MSKLPAQAGQFLFADIEVMIFELTILAKNQS